MNIRKAYHKWMSAFLAFTMMFSIIPVNVFQSTDSTAYAAHVIGGGGGLTGMQTGRWRANWCQNQQGVRISIVDNDGNIVMKKYDAIDILFSEPTARGPVYKFEGIKFQSDWNVDNKIFEIPVGYLNNYLIKSINDGPSSELLEHLQGTLKGTPESKPYPTEIDTMPQPIVQDSSGKYVGNGEEVKKFFVDGTLGSYKAGGYQVSIGKITGSVTAPTTPNYTKPSTPSTPTTPTVQNPSKPANTGNTTTTTNTPAVTTIKTPYGNVTSSWLATHANQCKNTSADALYNSRWMTQSEKSLASARLKGAQNRIRTIVKDALNGGCELTAAELAAKLNTIYSAWTYSYSMYLSGQTTYERMRVVNAEILEMINSAKQLYRCGLAVKESYHLPANDKTFIYKTYAGYADGSLYVVSDKILSVLNGIYVGYNEIPLGKAAVLVEDTSITTDYQGDTAKLYKADAIVQAYNDAVGDNDYDLSVLTTILNQSLIKVYGNQTASIMEGYALSKGAEKDDPVLVKDIMSLVGTGGKLSTSTVRNFLNKTVGGMTAAASEAIKQADIQGMMFNQNSEAEADAQAKAELEAEIAGQLFTAQMVKEELIPLIVDAMHSDGFTDVTYETILGILEGETEEEKLNIAANQINTVGLEAWLKSLNFSAITGTGSTLDIDAMKNAKGYIYALLDMKDDSGNFVFDIDIPVEKQAEFEAVAKDKTSPAQKFMFMGYGIVFEPIVWYAPVSSRSGNENSDWGQDTVDGYLYRSTKNYYITPTAFARYQMSNTSRRWYNEIGHISLGRVFPTSMYIDEKITYFEGGSKADGVITPISDAAMFTVKGTYHDKIAPRVSTKDLNNANFGYGWHFASGVQVEETLQVTWNDTVPSPGPAPDPTSLPDPSKKPDTGEPWDPTDPDYPYPDYPNGYPDKHFNIIKYYEIWDYSDPENPFVTERQGPTIRELNPNKIRIVDEPEFKVKDWYTTYLDGNFPNENDPNEIYDIHYADDIKEKTATSTGEVLTTVEMDKNNDKREDTLVVLLVKKINQPTPPPPGSGAITIQQSQITKTVRTNDGRIGGAPWGNYKFDFYIGEFQTTHSKKHQGCRCPGHGNRKNGYWSHSSPCRHPSTSCSMDMPGLAGDAELNYTFSGLHSISFGNSLEVGKGKHNELKPLTYSKQSGGDTSSYDFTLSGLNREEFHFTDDGRVLQGEEYVTVIWRHKDVPTMPIYKKADITNRWGDPHWSIPVSILPSDQKIPAKKRIDNGDRTYQLQINFGLNMGMSDIKATASCNSSDTTGTCGAATGCTYKQTLSTQLISGNWDYMFNASTLVKTWRGKAANKSHADEKMLPGNTNPVQKVQSGNHFEVTMVADQQTIKFFPYVKMTYLTNSLSMALQEENGVNVRQETYVFSEQESSILPNDAIEVGWVNGVENNSIELVSQQWSLHQRAVNNGKAWNGANQVLPGGAIYQLVIPEGQYTDVKIVTYQTVVDSETRTWLSTALTGDEYTETQVYNEHKQFVDTAADVLDKLRIVQWVNKNFNATTAWPANWDENAATTEVCVRGGGVDLTKLGLSHKSNSESKYYMQKWDFNAPASEGDLDILRNDQITTVFKAFTDTAGNVYVATYKLSGNDVAGMVDHMKDLNADTMQNKAADIDVLKVATKEKKWQDINTLLTGELKVIDDRTKFVTNVVKSLERNTGSDRTAAWAKDDGKWYNEAFDGIYLVRQASTLRVGFKDPLKRAAALDPALCPENKGESDLYSNAFLSQFCMNDRSDSAFAAGKEARYLATFKGQDILMPEMQGLYQTRKFYIPNANVQDLN